MFVFFSLLFSLLYWPAMVACLTISSSEQAVQLRLYFNQLAYQAISQAPFFGQGWGNFVWQVMVDLPGYEPWMYQPVHNIYLLIASEAGLVGLALFLLFLYFTFIKSKPELFVRTCFFVALAFLGMGFFDHYLLTLQQGSLMFWFLLGVLANRHAS